MEIYPAGSSFSLNELGNFNLSDPIEKGIRPDVWEMVVNASKVDDENAPTDEALELLEQRKDARARKDFAESDRLRGQIAELGWIVQDSKEGQKLIKR
jgi:cysteinyl-tRNA synthetase